MHFCYTVIHLFHWKNYSSLDSESFSLGISCHYYYYYLFTYYRKLVTLQTFKLLNRI